MSTIGFLHTRPLLRTAFSTSFGFESQVPSPICGIVALVFSDRVFPKDMVLVAVYGRKKAGKRGREGREVVRTSIPSHLLYGG